jgi:hypothetical protein
MPFVTITSESSTLSSSPLHWLQHDWAAAWAYLVELYGSSARQPYVSPDKFHKWIKHHSRNDTFNSVQHVDQYYHEYTAGMAPLLSAHFITTIEADLLFFKGIPRDLQVTTQNSRPFIGIPNKGTITTAH